MVAQVFVLLFAVVACAVAVPASIPQPRAPQPIEQRQVREVDPLETGAERAEDLKGSASHGYGYYGYGYPGYYGYGYPVQYGYDFPRYYTNGNSGHFQPSYYGGYSYR